MKIINLSQNTTVQNTRRNSNSKKTEKQNKSPKNNKVINFGATTEDSNGLKNMLNPLISINKFKMGGKLTQEEMEILKEKYPLYYKKAVEAEEHTKVYKKELENCKTKEEVDQLHERKVQEYHAKSQAITQSGMSKKIKEEEQLALGAELAAITKEHKEFLSSGQYQNLPDEEVKDVESSQQEADVTEQVAEKIPSDSEQIMDDSVEIENNSEVSESNKVENGSNSVSGKNQEDETVAKYKESEKNNKKQKPNGSIIDVKI